MNIHDLKTTPIERVENVSSDQVAEIIARARRPLILSGLENDMKFMRGLNLDALSMLSEKVPVQKPEADGVNYFVDYFRMSMAEFINRIKGGEGLYIGAREILSRAGRRSDKDGLGGLAERIQIPEWIDRNRVYSSTLWVGGGHNRTLLHYDPWDTYMMVGLGEKEFVVFPDTESSKMYGFGVLDYRSLNKGAVLHSKIRPMSVQPEYQKKFSKAQGFRGKINAGEIVYVPAGFWHYVESTGVNIGLNFFVHVKDPMLHFREPLRTYWVKDKITLQPIRWYWNVRMFCGRVVRNFLRKKAAV